MMSSFFANFSNDANFHATFGNIQDDQSILDKYDGIYDVIPKMHEQTLETKDKMMTKDVVIKGIPYSEVSNKTGTTIIIAS